jgi:two-component system, chemotaxis family, chemotaxis protein CheY
MKVLVVEDSATMRRIVVNTLQRLGYTDITEASDGAEALDRYDGTFDCVLTDWNMPNMGGLELVRELRGRVDGKDLKIIMITTRSVKEDILTAAQAGVNNYVVKPFTPEVLREKLDQVFGVKA